MSKKRISGFTKLLLITGSIAMVLSFIAYTMGYQGFIGEVHSEVFGVGFTLFSAGLVSLFFKKKIV